MNSTAVNVSEENTASPSAWGGVFAMSVCAFALIASEFLPVSLLTPIATDLHVTEGMAGQGIAISGVFAVLTSLFISSLAGSLDRKTLLLGLTAAMGISGAIVALLFDHSGYRATFIASAVMLLICALLTFLTARSHDGKTG